MFVRTKKGKIFDCVVHEQMGKPIYYPRTSKTNGYINWNEVYKKSENIIDILEVGDYVNGWKVLYWTDGTKIIDDGYASDLNKIKIKSIVTKEMFSSMEYRLGDDK